MDGTREDLVDMFIVHTLDEIQGLIDAHAQFKATLGEADKEFQSIISLIKEVENFAKQYNVPGATINPYTNLTGNDIQSKWNEVKTLVPQRDETLQDELRKQQNNEALRRQFADKSNQVGPWIERQMDAVSAIGMGMQVCIQTPRILKKAFFMPATMTRLYIDIILFSYCEIMDRHMYM